MWPLMKARRYERNGHEKRDSWERKGTISRHGTIEGTNFGHVGTIGTGTIGSKLPEKVSFLALSNRVTLYQRSSILKPSGNRK